MAIVLPPSTVPLDTDFKSDWPAEFRAWATKALHFMPLAWSETPVNLTAGTREMAVVFAADIGLTTYRVELELSGFWTTWSVIAKATTGFTVEFSDEVPASGGPQALWAVKRYL